MKRALLLVALLASACQGERGAGVYRETPEARQARQDAAFLAGERVGVGAIKGRLADIGIGPDRYRLVTDPDHGVELVELAGPPDGLSKSQREALGRLVVDSNFRLTFADAATERAVDPGEEMYRRDVITAIAELDRHGDWDRVPRMTPGESLTLLARRIEAWCDFERGDALNVIDERWLEYSHAPVDAAVTEPVPADAAARFDCLRRVVYATQLRRHFIGYRGEQPPPVYSFSPASRPSAP
ncbi:hypothetical protein GRI40_09125 [Altererythrobacter aerius]|uniref:Uncharacterized protein n=1 Tax=Tsuneonella aeria TaxID=1837929 RepID=A0A6I4TE90_9SPHN|nr:hypothetical protein [Tsuneonella aeria]MXO75373.1 hypothetical protein [Tsuneonella aeria]